MLIDIGLDLEDAASTGAQARAAEHAGFAGFLVSETRHDPFLRIVQAAATTERIELATSIAIAFARNPMNVAHLGYDLQAITGGRFVLGLGSQIQAHVENRYSMPWGKPVARMREYLRALRAIWTAWEEGGPLDFRGDYYKHTLMTPMFAPPRHAFGPPRVRLAAVGDAMTETAGRYADGLICHPFTSHTYLTEVTLPALRLGAEKSGRDVAALEMSGMLIMGLAETDEQFAAAAAAARRQVAFYASTPAYRRVLEVHGVADLQPVLRDLSKQGKWAEMGEQISDDLLAEFAAVGTPEQVHAAVHDRFEGLLDRVTVYTPETPAPGLLEKFLHLGAAPASALRAEDSHNPTGVQR